MSRKPVRAQNVAQFSPKSSDATSRKARAELEFDEPAVLGALDQGDVRQWIAGLAQRLLRQVDVATLGGQALAALTRDGHHQQWLDGLLQQMARWAEQASVQEQQRIEAADSVFKSRDPEMAELLAEAIAKEDRGEEVSPGEKVEPIKPGGVDPLCKERT